MSGSDSSLYNQIYKSIDRPYAHVDLSQMPWELVIKIMEQQALEARQITEQMMPMTITNYDYQQSQCNYNQITNSSEESDSNSSSSCFSDERMSSPEPQSDISQSESDIEIDVDSIEEESDDYYTSLDNIPITVLQFERSLRDKESKK